MHALLMQMHLCASRILIPLMSTGRPRSLRQTLAVRLVYCRFLQRMTRRLACQQLHATLRKDALAILRLQRASSVVVLLT